MMSSVPTQAGYRLGEGCGGSSDDLGGRGHGADEAQGLTNDRFCVGEGRAGDRVGGQDDLVPEVHRLDAEPEDPEVH